MIHALLRNFQHKIQQTVEIISLISYTLIHSVRLCAQVYKLI